MRKLVHRSFSSTSRFDVRGKCGSCMCGVGSRDWCRMQDVADGFCSGRSCQKDNQFSRPSSLISSQRCTTSHASHCSSAGSSWLGCRVVSRVTSIFVSSLKIEEPCSSSNQSSYSDTSLRNGLPSALVAMIF